MGVLCYVQKTHGQGLASNLVCLYITSDTTILLPEQVLPSTLKMTSVKDGPMPISFSSALNLSPVQGDTLLLSYRLLDLHKGSTGKKDHMHLMTSRAATPQGRSQAAYDPIEEKGLQYQGSFGRGISMGNAQSLLLNSNFNLQLAGEIGDGIEVVGAISDNTIPIQPEGDTRQLEEFDKVFIQVKKDQHRLTAGDYTPQMPYGYYLNFNKRLSGLQYATSDSINDWGYEAQGSFAAARGEFARQTLAPREGNQGPYQLSGNEGERFLVILAGTERVFWDGEMLQRGADQDYTIDYNQGQIHFTYNRLVTVNTRIIVEFEYIVRDYGRSVWTANGQIANQRSSFYVNAYQHKDSKNPATGAWDSLSLARLSEAGDDLLNAFGNGARQATEEDLSQRVLYVRRDTFYFVDGKKVDTTIYIHRNRPAETDALVVRFSPVGQGNGDYQLASTSTNGRVYRWVAPDPASGQSQGAYSPITRLAAPETHRIITLGGHLDVLPGLTVSSEMIISQEDLNLLSSNDDDDNTGLGGHLNLAYSRALGSDWTGQVKLRSEFIQQEVRVMAPFRNAEFQRDWNQDLASLSDEVLSTAEILFKKSNSQSIRFTSNLLNQNTHSSHRHEMDIQTKLDGWAITSRSSVLKSGSKLLSSSFSRPHLRLTKNWKGNSSLTWGAEYLAENNKQSNQAGLDQRSYRWDQWKSWATVKYNEALNSRIEVIQRLDQTADSSSLKMLSTATDYVAGLDYAPDHRLHFKLDIKARKFDVHHEAQQLQDKRTLLLRFDQRANVLNNGLFLQTSYELGSGQEPQLEFVFEERLPGQGNYIYKDLNNDGIKQVNEYIPAPFTDTARYVRIQLLNNNFITTNNLVFSQNLRLQPGRWIKGKNFWNRLEWTALVKTSAKQAGDMKFNPYTATRDSSNISFSGLWQHQVTINKGHPKFDIQVGQRRSDNTSSMISGRESRSQSEYFLRSRYNVSRTSDFLLNLEIADRRSTSEFFEERHYDLREFKLQPQYNLLWKRKWRVRTQYDFQSKKNEAHLGGETMFRHQGEISLGFNQSQVMSIQSTLRYARVHFTGSGNEALNFIMLQDLRPGSNYIWEVRLNRNIFSNVQMTISYDGRKNGDGRVLHSGRASFRANF